MSKPPKRLGKKGVKRFYHLGHIKVEANSHVINGKTHTRRDLVMHMNKTPQGYDVRILLVVLRRGYSEALYYMDGGHGWQHIRWGK